MLHAAKRNGRGSYTWAKHVLFAVLNVFLLLFFSFSFGIRLRHWCLGTDILANVANYSKSRRIALT